MMAKKILPFIISLLLTSSCSSLPNNVAGNWQNSFQAIKGVIFGYEDYPLTREVVENIPYASMRLKIGKGSAGLLILESKKGTVNTWISSDQVRVVEKNGQIIRTTGLLNNLTSFRSNEISLFDLVTKDKMLTFKNYISLENPKVFELELKVNIQNLGVEQVHILGKNYSLIHFIKEKENQYIRWKSEDHYWVSQEDGFVWKSIQNIAPNIPPITIEITKKPAN